VIAVADVVGIGVVVVEVDELVELVVVDSAYVVSSVEVTEPPLDLGEIGEFDGRNSLVTNGVNMRALFLMEPENMKMK